MKEVIEPKEEDSKMDFFKIRLRKLHLGLLSPEEIDLLLTPIETGENLKKKRKYKPVDMVFGNIF